MFLFGDNKIQGLSRFDVKVWRFDDGGSFDGWWWFPIGFDQAPLRNHQVKRIQPGKWWFLPQRIRNLHQVNHLKFRGVNIWKTTWKLKQLSINNWQPFQIGWWEGPNSWRHGKIGCSGCKAPNVHPLAHLWLAEHSLNAPGILHVGPKKKFNF